MFVDIVKTWQNSNDNLACIYTCITAERSDVGDEVLSRGRYWHDKSMLAWLTVISTKSKHTQILTFLPYNNSRLITSAVRFYLPNRRSIPSHLQSNRKRHNQFIYHKSWISCQTWTLQSYFNKQIKGRDHKIDIFFLFLNLRITIIIIKYAVEMMPDSWPVNLPNISH